ncbi:uncharacterized protein LOC118417404 [Branchiostoma floridae]|uniref:Uncharacterized protein LOC118417404 n=1 Tax=Branchiostoma floridae TaxID=7739 RepID=A0A9J7LBG1_BRAFL|nr:uncharacterized protein LOC118417404 [Branchiostoma floridae]
MSGAGYAGRHPSSGGTPAPEQPRRSRYDYENFSQFRGRCGVLNEPIFAAVPPRRKPGLPPSRQRGGAAEIADRGRPSETKDTEPVYGSIPDTASCNPSGARQVPRRDSLGLYKNQMYAASGPPDCRLHLGDEPCDTDTDTGPDPENAPPPPQSPAPPAWVTQRVFWLAQLAVGAAVLMLLIPLLITMATGGTCQACETKELRDQLQSLQIRVGDVAIMVLNMKEKYGKPEAPPAESQHVPVSGLTATDSTATHRTDRRGPPAEGRLQPEVLPDPARVKEPLQKLAEEAHDVVRDTDPVRTVHSALVPGPTADTPEPPLIPAAVQENRPGLPVKCFTRNSPSMIQTAGPS